MSIINQALKKAQREQLLHQRGEIASLGTPSTASRFRWRWLVLTGGLLCTLGAGVGLHAWYTADSDKVSVATPAIKPAVPQSQQRPTSGPGRPSQGQQDHPVAASSDATAARPKRPVVPTEAHQQGGSPRMSRRLSEVQQESRVLQPRSPLGTRPRPQATTSSPPAALPALEPQGEVVANVPSQSEMVASAASAASASHSQPVPPRVTPAAVPVAPLASPPPTSTPEPAVIPDRPSATALFERALTAQQTGNVRQAIRLFKRATQADPTMKSAYSHVGNLYYQQQRYQEALEAYQQALALDPDDVKTRNNLGSTYIQLAMDEDAIKELQQALQLDKSYSLAYYNLACVHARAGQSTEAVQYLQQAIVLTPEARQWAQTDADFAPVRSHPDVRRLLEP